MRYAWFLEHPAMRRAFTLSVMVVLAAFLILPLLTLLLWAFSERWFYPALVPQQFGLKWWSWILENTDISKLNLRREFQTSEIGRAHV